jgi:hypothetical protein
MNWFCEDRLERLMNDLASSTTMMRTEVVRHCARSVPTVMDPPTRRANALTLRAFGVSVNALGITLAQTPVSTVGSPNNTANERQRRESAHRRNPRDQRVHRPGHRDGDRDPPRFRDSP